MENPDPVSYPTVQIDGKAVEVKFRCGDIIRLKKVHKIEIEKLDTGNLADNLERSLTILSAGISHQVKKTVDELMDSINFADFKDIAAAIGESLKKAIPPKKIEEPSAPIPTTLQ